MAEMLDNFPSCFQCGNKLQGIPYKGQMWADHYFFPMHDSQDAFWVSNDLMCRSDCRMLILRRAQLLESSIWPSLVKLDIHMEW